MKYEPTPTMKRLESGLLIPQGASILTSASEAQAAAIANAEQEKIWNATLAEESKAQAEFIAIVNQGFQFMVKLGWGVDEVADSIRSACPDVSDEWVAKLKTALLKLGRKFAEENAGLGMVWGQFSLCWQLAIGKAPAYAMFCWWEARKDRWEKGGYGWREADVGPYPDRPTPPSQRHNRPVKVENLGVNRRHRIAAQNARVAVERCPRGHLLQNPPSKDNKQCNQCHRLQKGKI
jgi:hypothetical protein